MNDITYNSQIINTMKQHQESKMNNYVAESAYSETLLKCPFCNTNMIFSIKYILGTANRFHYCPVCFYRTDSYAGIHYDNKTITINNGGSI